MGPKAKAREAFERYCREYTNGAWLRVVEAIVEALPDDQPEPPADNPHANKLRELARDLEDACDDRGDAAFREFVEEFWPKLYELASAMDGGEGKPPERPAYDVLATKGDKSIIGPGSHDRPCPCPIHNDRMPAKPPEQPEPPEWDGTCDQCDKRAVCGGHYSAWCEDHGPSPSKPPEQPEPAKTWPCSRCGIERTKEQGGEIFTMCDVCWEEAPPAPEQPAPIVRWALVGRREGDIDEFWHRATAESYATEGCRVAKLVEAGDVAKRLREIAMGVLVAAGTTAVGELLDLARELEADS